MSTEFEKGLIIIVDDNEDDYLRISRIIGKDYQIFWHDGVKNILSLIEEKNPVCILLDFHMGSLNGLDILNKLRHNKKTEHIPVMMLTNEDNPEIIISCMKQGADDYLIKDSVQKDRLLTSLGIIIEKASLQKRIDNLESILPICANCKKIRKSNADPKSQDSWEGVEHYISRFTDSMISHGICPECALSLYGLDLSEADK
ncbi:MAG: response regulator [Candidatus Marinimicrobia bacterium]|nr:response regulator [Candidatus Neomarinimicrobiota bacterium]